MAVSAASSSQIITFDGTQAGVDAEFGDAGELTPQSVHIHLGRKIPSAINT